MKVYLSEINESWIIDRVRDEWHKSNQEISTENIHESDVIWIISPWLWKKLPKKLLEEKKVLCSIYHFEEKDFTRKALKNFYKRDSYVQHYHVISPKVKNQLESLTTKPVTYIPFWVNQKIWYNIPDKKSLRKKYDINLNTFVAGSFQRDTEGKDLKSPKLIKGPDRFLEIAVYLNKKYDDFKVVLSGTRRQYVINELEKENIEYVYFEMADFKQLNELYNLLDLYIVSSRIEGGPQAIVESGITRTPIISTDVGFASDILSEESIYDMSTYSDAMPNVEYAYKNSLKLTIPDGFEKFKNTLLQTYKN